MSTHEIHSQASNYPGFVKTGVDPRTGQFTLAISLPLPPANNLAGPALTPILAFSSMGSTQNRGFGLGWTLNLSQLSLDPDASSLRLTSGEQFAVDWDNSDLSIGGKLVLLDYKLQSLVVTRLTENSFRVDLKSGESEILTRQDNGHYYLTELRTAEGRRVFVDWLPFDDSHCIVDRIRDESRTLLQIVREYGEVHITRNPDVQNASSTLRLLLSNDRLTDVYVPEIDQPFAFSYETYPVAPGADWLCPDKLSGPLGAWDRVNWATGEHGHPMPGDAPFQYLPRVASWTCSSGQPGSELHRYYQWIGDRNFLGFGSDQRFDWQRGRDNLYQVESDYEYEVVETQRDNDDQLLATVTRTWNRFHLQTQEVSTHRQCEVRVSTTYGIDPELTWEQQPAWCQLPHKIVTTYIDRSQGDAQRSEQTESRYDQHGNVLLIRYPSGVEERNEYYPATATEGCPADALNMVRYLKRKTVIPARGQGPKGTEAAVIAISYTYQTLNSLLNDGLPHAVVVSEQAHDTTHDQLMEITRQFYADTGDAHHGREIRSINTLNGKATTTSYRYEISEDQLITHVTVDGFENNPENRSTSSSAQSLLTGLTTVEQNEAGVRTGYQYDSLGRVVRTVVAQGSPYEAVKTARYAIVDLSSEDRSDNSTHAVLVEHTDVTGQRRRSWLDGMGRTVRVELEDLDHAPGVFREIARTAYDAQGRVTHERRQDWLEGVQRPLALSTLKRYDDWGNIAQVETPDGVIAHTRHDPVTCRTEQWQQSGARRGPRTVTLNNPAAGPAEQQLYDEMDRLIRTTHWVRDGLDRVIEERVRVDGQTDMVTRSRFDAYSRVVERELADGALITWTYAAHSDAEHPETVSVTPAKEAQA